MSIDHAQVAKICHEANRAYCETIGDHTQKSWEEAGEWQRKSAVSGVAFALLNQNAPASHQHDAWVKDKLADGWKYGTVKDAEKKEHPCIVPYEMLPPAQRMKDHLFKAIVTGFMNAKGW